MKFTKLLIVFLFASALSLNAQQKEYAQKLIDTLASPEFHGRGYVNNGDRIAANFIVEKLKEFGTKPFTENYFQEYYINVNTFPGKMFLKIGNKTQKAGVDYLVLSTSNSISGKYKLKIFDKNNYKEIVSFKEEKKNNLFLVLDTLGINNKVEAEKLMAFKDNRLETAGIIEIHDKNLVYAPSQFQNSFVSIKLKRENLPKKIKNAKIEIENKFITNYKTQNIATYVEGEIDSFIVFSAHYDHIGRMGAETYFPGANDNASGTAMLLSLAKYYSTHKPKYSIAFLFFSAEEAGILGSIHYNRNPLFPLSKIKFLTNLDMVGSGDEGMKVVNATIFKREFALLQEINKKNNYLPKVASRGPAANSDHYFFYVNKVPCFFIYTLGKYKEYHNIYDKSEALPLNKFEELFNLLIKFADNIQ